MEERCGGDSGKRSRGGGGRTRMGGRRRIKWAEGELEWAGGGWERRTEDEGRPNDEGGGRWMWRLKGDVGGGLGRGLGRVGWIQRWGVGVGVWRER